MKRVAKVASPAAIAVLRQATALFPKRKKISDGLLPSPAHLKASPSSDHNTGLAVDLTHDPKNGIDCAVIFEKLKEDERVSYLIFNKKIWARKLKLSLATVLIVAATLTLSIYIFLSMLIRLMTLALGSGG
jgi:hypothetical protein